MCGRYASARSVEDLASTFGIGADDVESIAAPDWNIAPTKPVTAVLVRDGRLVLTTLTWGLVPSWADDPGVGPRMFNARVETVEDKPAFRDVFRRRRCLLPADGWYEWARWPDGRRVPHYLTSPTGSVLALAGLWDRWYAADGRPLDTATILTSAAPAHLRDIHDRSPVVMSQELWSSWLDPATPPEAVAGGLRPVAASTVVAWPVGSAVGDVANNGVHLTERVEVLEQPPLF